MCAIPCADHRPTECRENDNSETHCSSGGRQGESLIDHISRVLNSFRSTQHQVYVPYCYSKLSQQPSQRGHHDIKDELVFDSNPQFVFHDSGGIEAGTTKEMEAIQTFISERADAQRLNNKLH